MTLICVHSPETESELAVILAMLEAHGIPCFVHNRYFGGLYPGLQINAYNTQSIMVPEECVADAVDLLAPFRGATRDDRPPLTMTWCDKLRMVVEVLLGGWFVPGSRSRKQHKSRRMKLVASNGSEKSD